MNKYNKRLDSVIQVAFLDGVCLQKVPLYWDEFLSRKLIRIRSRPITELADWWCDAVMRFRLSWKVLSGLASLWDVSCVREPTILTSTAACASDVNETVTCTLSRSISRHTVFTSLGVVDMFPTGTTSIAQPVMSLDVLVVYWWNIVAMWHCD